MISPSKTLIAGVTGGIGTGKTEVCKIFTSLGAKVLSADAIAKDEIATNAQIRQNIRREFGFDAFFSDGTLDRRKMAKLVFSDNALVKKLNAIVHPATLKKIQDDLQAAKNSRRHAMIVIEAALMYESGAHKLCDYIIVVEASEKEAIRRVMKRDAVPADDVKQRIRAQMPADEKSMKADFIIHNSGDLNMLQKNCMFLFSLFTAIASETEKGLR